MSVGGRNVGTDLPDGDTSPVARARTLPHRLATGRQPMGGWNTTQMMTRPTPSPADREKALEAALAQIDRQFGKGTVMRLGSDERAPVAVIPTGSIALDVALGIGGLPRGRIIEIYGPESSGKTTLTLHAIANA